MNNMFTDIGHYSLNKYGEYLCGDQVNVVDTGNGSMVMVLADGLGSGVKACILSTLTAKITATMISQSMSIEECVATIAATLPMCEWRKLAYSTFTIVKVKNSREAEIIQYDNPHAIILREGKNLELPMTSMEIGGKTIYRSRLKLLEHDVILAFSDGVTHAGVGETLNLEWQRENIIDFVEKKYKPSVAAKTLTTILLDECSRLYAGKPSDDTTVCAIKIRSRNPVNLLFGPPSDRDDDRKMLSLFFGKAGKHIICGGTTASIAAAYLDKPLKTDCCSLDADVPPSGCIDGVDLVTEGLITMQKVLEYARNYLGDNACYFDWYYNSDGASRIAQLLLEEGTDISFFVGRAVNPAHQNPGLSLEFNIKMRLVEELAATLRKMGKRIKVSYF